MSALDLPKVYTYIKKTYNLYINRRRHGVPSLSVYFGV